MTKQATFFEFLKTWYVSGCRQNGNKLRKDYFLGNINSYGYNHSLVCFMKTRYVIRISGNVQKMGFRFWIREKARDLNLTGFVRNQDNGDVYILAQGEKDDLDDFLDLCAEGPEMAVVKKVDHKEEEIDENIESFEIMQH